jgi:8-oxo-dGTP pyrophosphatase MutT (NUDIX family)
MTRETAQDPRRLPPQVTGRARRDGAAVAVPARDAATVVLLRDRGGRVEAYLLRRVASMAFAAGMHVFPGGSVDARDEALPDTAWAGSSPREWVGILTADERLARALVCAAVRETFEESGVLLAGPSATEVVSDTAGEDWEMDRQRLLDRSQSLAELLERRRLVLRADLLRPWAHWITPEGEPKRFDTRFFVAALPPGQRARAVGGESDQAEWLAPDDALERAERGNVVLLPPTAFTLGELAAYRSVDAVLAAAATRDIRPVLPRIVVTGEDAAVLLPGDGGYDA